MQVAGRERCYRFAPKVGVNGKATVIRAQGGREAADAEQCSARRC
jgi:hypothetical protein